jgi:hypothetical protein
MAMVLTIKTQKPQYFHLVKEKDLLMSLARLSRKTSMSLEQHISRNQGNSSLNHQILVFKSKQIV